MPKLHIDFSKGGAQNGWDGILTGSGLRSILEGKNFQSLDKFFPFVAAFINRSTGHDSTTPMTMVHTCYSDIICQMVGKVGKRVSSQEKLKRLGEKINKFKSLLLGMFKVHCASCLHTLQYRLLDHTVDDIQKFGTLSVLEWSPYEHYNVHSTKEYRQTLQIRQTRTMDGMKVTDRGYAKTLPPEKKNTTGSILRSE